MIFKGKAVKDEELTTFTTPLIHLRSYTIFSAKCNLTDESGNYLHDTIGPYWIKVWDNSSRVCLINVSDGKSLSSSYMKRHWHNTLKIAIRFADIVYYEGAEITIP